MEMREFRTKFGWRRDYPEGYSAAQLASILGVHKRTIHRWSVLGTPKTVQLALDSLAQKAQK